MDTPPSINRFALWWWGATFVWLAGTVLAWARTQHTLFADPRTVPVAGYAQPVTVALVLAITVALWWAVRRGSNVARWLAVVTAMLSALQALGRLIGLATATAHPLSLLCFLVAAAMTIAAAAALFRTDARLWFGEIEDDDMGELDA